MAHLTESICLPESTVDRLISGTPADEVQGIAVMWLASYAAIQQALQLGANLMITHEGVFYSHHETAEDEEHELNPVYREKLDCIQSGKLSIYRFHDAPHRYVPDIITRGLVATLGWENEAMYPLATAATVALPEERSLRDIINHVRRALDLPYVRFVGDLDSRCSRIGVTVGYRGGGAHAIPLLREQKLDLLIAGEGPEWETSEYIHDAVSLGRRQSLLLLGHAASEDPGMALVAKKLQAAFPDVPVHYISSEPRIQVL